MIPCVSRHSVFGDNFWVNSDSVFSDNSRSAVSSDLVCADDKKKKKKKSEK